jgi:uncharacterized RDD family membrane protein YckC
MNQDDLSSKADIVLNSATINERFIAYVLDMAPFMAGWTLSFWALTHSYSWPLELSPFRVSILWILAYVLYHFFGVLMGGTLGKRLMDIAVVDGNGHKPGLLQAFIRANGEVLSAPLFNFGFLIALIRSDSRALHDLISGTYVVQLRPKNKVESSTLFLAAFGILIFLYGFIIHGMLHLPNSQDQLALKKSADALYVVSQIEESYKSQHGAYTDSLEDLAVASGDPHKFREAMSKLFNPDRFRLQAGTNVYRISAEARDRRRTHLILECPPLRVHL